MRNIAIVIALAAAVLFMGVGFASHPITVDQNPDVNCDGSVTIGDINIVVAAFGETGLQQGLCDGSFHYEAGCTTGHLVQAIVEDRDASWIADQLETHCLA